jgi:hypothetical protein
MVADAGETTRARSVESRTSRHAAACEVNMLDFLYIVVVLVFFALMWGFTRASERL